MFRDCRKGELVRLCGIFQGLTGRLAALEGKGELCAASRGVIVEELLFVVLPGNELILVVM